MNILATVLLTILVMANIFLIAVIMYVAKKLNDKPARRGNSIILTVLVADFLAIIGGFIL